MDDKCCFEHKASDFPLDIAEYFKMIENYVCPFCGTGEPEVKLDV